MTVWTLVACAAAGPYLLRLVAAVLRWADKIWIGMVMDGFRTGMCSETSRPAPNSPNQITMRWVQSG